MQLLRPISVIMRESMYTPSFSSVAYHGVDTLASNTTDKVA